MADNSPGDEFELSNSAPDVSNDISSCLEYAKVDKSNHLVGPNFPPSLRSSVSFFRDDRDARWRLRDEMCL